MFQDWRDLASEAYLESLLWRRATLNHTVGSTNAIGFYQTLSESITYVFGTLIFLQELVDFGEESGFVVRSKELEREDVSATSSSSVSLTQVHPLL